MYLTVRALVLRVVPYNDTDALLTLLTHKHGKLTAKARGLRRKNSPLSASCQLLSYSEFTLFEYRGMYTINEAQSIELFTKLHRDILKLSLGTYFVQVAEVISQEDLPNPQLQSLVLNCLYALANLGMSDKKVKAAFELRAICLAGYSPDLHGCYRCNHPLPNRFNIGEGRLECTTCRDPWSDGIRIPVSQGTVEAMRYICYCELKQLLAFQAGAESLECLAQVSESYLSSQLERGFTTLDFYKSLLFQE